MELKINILVLVAMCSTFWVATAYSEDEQGQEQLKLGQRAYLRCIACHTLEKGQPHLAGPNLHGIFSATAGSQSGYAYSSALKTSTVVWDEASMRAWLHSPATFIPGNKMAFGGVASDQEMGALITYLQAKTE